jgi:hypothetical protein
LRRNPQGTIEKRGARATVKPTLTTSYKTASQNENSVYHKTKVRNAKLRKELRGLDDQIQVRRHLGRKLQDLDRTENSNAQLKLLVIKLERPIRTLRFVNEAGVSDTRNASWCRLHMLTSR